MVNCTEANEKHLWIKRTIRLMITFETVNPGAL